MFGITIVTKKGLAKIERNAKDRAIVELIALLRCKDKIYLEPVTLIGNNQTIQHCVFLGIEDTALMIKSVSAGEAAGGAG